jgi:hypothetical protein
VELNSFPAANHDCLLPPLIGAVAQLGEHLLCKQGVSGSIPLSSTKFMVLTLSRLCRYACRTTRRTIGVGLCPCLVE